MENLTSMKDTGSVMRRLVKRGFSMSMKIPCGYMMKISATGPSTPSRDGHSARVVSPREVEKGKQGKNKGKGYQARRFFRPYRKGGGKGKKGGKSSSSTAKANVAEEEVEEEEMEDDALLADKKKRKRRPQGKRKGKAQPAASTAHEAEAALDEDGFAYSAVSYPLEIVSYDQEWCLKGTKGVQEEVEDGTSMILDTGCTKAMCSRHAYLLMRQGLSEDRVELLPDASAFNFANGQKALAREKVQDMVLI